jgi:hypothetical protein
MSAKKTTAKKTAAKKTNGNGNKGTGYKCHRPGKGHRPGSAKEKLHQLFDKHGAEKARPLALKQVAVGTVNTSFSQFRKVSGKKA